MIFLDGFPDQKAEFLFALRRYLLQALYWVSVSKTWIFFEYFAMANLLF